MHGIWQSCFFPSELMASLQKQQSSLLFTMAEKKTRRPKRRSARCINETKLVHSCKNAQFVNGIWRAPNPGSTTVSKVRAGQEAVQRYCDYHVELVGLKGFLALRRVIVSRPGERPSRSGELSSLEDLRPTVNFLGSPSEACKDESKRVKPEESEATLSCLMSSIISILSLLLVTDDWPSGTS